MTKKKDILVPEGWYDFEVIPANLNQLFKFIRQIQKNRSDLLLWRGLNNANFSNVSSFDRFISKRGKTPDPYEALELSSYKFWGDNLGYRISGHLDPRIQVQMQHEAVPTRFIDVTLSPLVALWFASNNLESNIDGRILAFEVFDKTALVPPRGRSTEAGEYFGVWIPESGLHPWIDAQQGAFIYGEPLEEDFEDDPIPDFGNLHQATTVPYAKARIRKSRSFETGVLPRCYTIRIGRELKGEIIEFLDEVASISRPKLFPGFRGLAKAHAEGLIKRL